MRKLLKEGILISGFVKKIFPLVDKSLAQWREHASRIPDPVLAKQALASITSKRFHCQGGSIYALYPGADREGMVRFIVAFQTISDYLDNLCDRAGWEEEESFRQLHRAMREALSPELPLSDYYACYPYKNDGGYLAALVETCRECVARFPAYVIVRQEALDFVDLYCDLQSLKHLGRDRREERMIQWANRHLPAKNHISVWEFGAASGSTLGVFMLCAAACRQDLSREEAAQIKKAYFPYICGLHILLDYFIDQAEDRQEGDLNFIFYYRDQQEAEERLGYFLRNALDYASALQQPDFHRAVIKGLLALYLSDEKTQSPLLKGSVRALLGQSGKSCNFLYFICRILRRSKII